MRSTRHGWWSPGFRWTVVVVIVLTLLLALAACGSRDEPAAEPEESTSTAGESGDDPQSSAETEDAEPGQILNNVLMIDSLTELVERFEVLAYTWEVSGEDMHDDSCTVCYEYKGETTLDDQPVDEVAITVGSDSDLQEMGFWIDSDGKTVQALIEGEKVQGELIEMMTQSILTFVFMPFQMAQAQGFTEAQEDEDVTWTFNDHAQRSGTCAGHNVTIHSFQVTDIINDIDFTWEVTDFGEFQVFTGWTSDGAGQKSEVHLIIDELQAR